MRATIFFSLKIPDTLSRSVFSPTLTKGEKEKQKSKRPGEQVVAYPERCVHRRAGGATRGSRLRACVVDGESKRESGRASSPTSPKVPAEHRSKRGRRAEELTKEWYRRASPVRDARPDEHWPRP